MLKRHVALGLAMGFIVLGCKKEEKKEEEGGFLTASEALSAPANVEPIAVDDLETELRNSSFLGEFDSSGALKKMAACMDFLNEVTIESDEKTIKVAAEKTYESCEIDPLTLTDVSFNIYAEASCDGTANYTAYNGKKFSELEAMEDSNCVGNGTNLFNFSMKGTAVVQDITFTTTSINGTMTTDGKPCQITGGATSNQIGDGCVEFSKTSYDTDMIKGSFETAVYKSVVENQEGDIISGTVEFTLNDWKGTLTIKSRQEVDYSLSNGTETKTGTLTFPGTTTGLKWKIR